MKMNLPQENHAMPLAGPTVILTPRLRGAKDLLFHFLGGNDGKQILRRFAPQNDMRLAHPALD